MRNFLLVNIGRRNEASSWSKLIFSQFAAVRFQEMRLSRARVGRSRTRNPNSTAKSRVRQNPRRTRPDRAGKSKPDLPPPVDKELVPQRSDGSVSENLRLAAESETAMAYLLHSLPNYVVIFWGQKQGMQGADIITFSLRTKQITLWDVKYRTSAVRLQPSKTFQQGSFTRENAIEQAMRAVSTSQADRDHALKALSAKSIRTVTVGSGNAKNSTVGD